MPRIEVRPKRLGGATYQVPTQVRRDRSEALAMRWIILSARSKKGRPMSVKLSEELKEAAAGQGIAIKRKETAPGWLKPIKLSAHFKW